MAGRIRVREDGSDESGVSVEHVAPAGPKPAPPETVKADTVIERPDLGAGFTTIVRKGDAIPPGLDKLPRRPVATGDSRPARATTSKRSSTRRSGARGK